MVTICTYCPLLGAARSWLRYNRRPGQSRPAHRTRPLQGRDGGLEQRRGQPLRGGHPEVRQGLQRHQKGLPALEVDEKHYRVFLHVEDN